MSCVHCHGGNANVEEMNEQGMEVAHQGVVTDPSDVACSNCHSNIVAQNESSIHTKLSGMKSALEARGGDLSEGSALSQAFENHCDACHTTCGQCHISIPTQAGGGLTSAHEFKNPPKMRDNCVTCHGARVGNEFLGNNEGVPRDVHRMKGMQCSNCHGQELHASSGDTRYHTAGEASCGDADCHSSTVANTEGNPQHQQHLDDLSCQVCHSVEYKSCYNCHVELDEKGEPTFATDSSEMGFKIGLNPIRSDERASKYVTLRHVPANVSSFDYYGENLLPNFDDAPTWKYATPHNIQLNTPQNESCDSCHGNAALFLTEDDVSADELEANRNVIVKEVPFGGQ